MDPEYQGKQIVPANGFNMTGPNGGTMVMIVEAIDSGTAVILHPSYRDDPSLLAILEDFLRRYKAERAPN